MKWIARIYIGFMIVAVASASYMTYTGMLLPSADSDTQLSLKNVETRRTHFVYMYALGK